MSYRNSFLGLAIATMLVACGGGGGGSSDPTSPPASTNPPTTTPPTNEQPPNNGTPTLPEPELEAPQNGTTPELPSSSAPAMPPPPPSHQVPAGVDTSNPSVALKPSAATASTSQGANTAPKTIDGNTTATRWESAQTDSEYIQFDFGAKTMIGSMKLTWENAYGKEYSILVSDDGQTWYQLRYVSGSKGGQEQFMNLNSNVQYVRINGIKRATQYGYSLYEVEFRSPGSDNTLGAKVTPSYTPFPSSGEPVAATTPQPLLEGVQFSLADGTLVTRYAQVGRSRHGRERGEDWNEIGYGPNETVDAAGNPVDKQPGAYLNFVAQYFDGRSWGVEIIENSRVAGVTKPTLRVNQYFQQDQKAGGHSFFRGFDRPGVTGFGWMSPGQLVDPSLYLNEQASCKVQPKPPEGRLANASGLNDGCSVTLDNYPGHAELSPDGNGVLVPNGKTVPARSLKTGDVIEVTMSFFSTPEAMAAAGNKGTGRRYYTNELTYVVGSGLRPQYGVQPRLMNAPLPEETWQGGLGSVSYDYADNSEFMFQQPFNHIGMQNMQRFLDGRRLFHSDMRTGAHNENGNEPLTEVAGLQGMFFNQGTCFGCHKNNGRSMAPVVVNQRLDTMVVRAAEVDGNGRQLPHPMYGAAVQMNSQPATGGVTTDWGTAVRVAGFDSKSMTLSDGSMVQLRKPRISFDGPTPSVYSLRSAQPVIGMGLLEAIPDADIIARARVAPDSDGVKGTVNYVYDPETKAVRVGRYGWKASKATLRHQVALAALQDMSVTSPVYPNRDCLFGPARCSSSIKVEPGLSEANLKLLTRYVAFLGVPAQRSLVSGFPKGVAPLSYLDVNPDQIAAGSKVFDNTRCGSCHTRVMKTGTSTELAEARDQMIRPYTDLLLHDMGVDLADGIVEGQATGSMWRTSALWGIGYTKYVAGKDLQVGYLHDSRARTLTEAILWHGGEATTSRQMFQQLTTQDREALLAFLNSL